MQADLSLRWTHMSEEMNSHVNSFGGVRLFQHYLSDIEIMKG